MPSALPKVLLMVAVPVVTFVGGAWLMGLASDRAYVGARLERNAEPRDRTPLNQRLRYDDEDVRRHWDALDARARAAERRFLLLDLAFPVLYGGAFLASFAIGARAAGIRGVPPWFIGVVAVTVLGDWVENVVHLAQLQHYTAGGGDALSAGAIGAASIATLVKLVCFTAASLTLVPLAVGAFWPSLRR
jgi:hypothetical protein